MHWRDSSGLGYTTKSLTRRVRLVAQHATIARLWLHPRRPRVTFEAPARENGTLSPILILGLFAPLLALLPLSETEAPDAETEEE
jgi:hypothetical protein